MTDNVPESLAIASHEEAPAAAVERPSALTNYLQEVLTDFFFKKLLGEETYNTVTAELVEEGYTQEQIEQECQDIRKGEHIGGRVFEKIAKAKFNGDVVKTWHAIASPEVQAKVASVAASIGVPEEWVLHTFHIETAGTMRHDIGNNGGYYGYIQIGKAAAKELQITPEALRALGPVEQLDYVEQYWHLHMPKGGYETPGDLYAVVAASSAGRRGMHEVIYPKGGSAYENNRLWAQYSEENGITRASYSAMMRDRYPSLYDEDGTPRRDFPEYKKPVVATTAEQSAEANKEPETLWDRVTAYFSS
ncbi:hypothetical protein H6771_02890 [Candidatus Peribacteria bacterium]|nr:hypothetical protein [Candidatus Peribacteria bacterium]